MSNKKTSRKYVSTPVVYFPTERFADIGITWAVGTNTLMLNQREGGETINLLTTTFAGAATLDNAQMEAENWYAALGDIFEEEEPNRQAFIDEMGREEL